MMGFYLQVLCEFLAFCNCLISHGFYFEDGFGIWVENYEMGMLLLD
jgi:hypothetical protein